MELANRSCDRTIELLPNLQIVIKKYDFYFQIQVIKSISFEILFGYLFFTLI